MSALQMLVIISFTCFIFAVYLTMPSVAQPVMSYLLYRPSITTILFSCCLYFLKNATCLACNGPSSGISNKNAQRKC